MSAVCMVNVRQDEAKGHVDNLLIQPIRRSSWLAKRLILIIVMTSTISLLTGYLVWQIAAFQNVHIDLWIMTQNSIALIGTIVLTVGIGATAYGLLPRLTAIVMYAVIIWAFVVDVLKSFFSLGDFIDKTSLLHYVSFAPTKAPDWQTFAWLICVGLLLSVIGIVGFARRDIVTE
mgnify:FL=1